MIALLGKPKMAREGGVQLGPDTRRTGRRGTAPVPEDVDLSRSCHGWGSFSPTTLVSCGTPTGSRPRADAATPTYTWPEHPLALGRPVHGRRPPRVGSRGQPRVSSPWCAACWCGRSMASPFAACCRPMARTRSGGGAGADASGDPRVLAGVAAEPGDAQLGAPAPRPGGGGSAHRSGPGPGLDGHTLDLPVAEGRGSRRSPNGCPPARYRGGASPRSCH